MNSIKIPFLPFVLNNLFQQNLTTIRSAPNILTSETEKHQNEEKEKVLNRIKKVEDDIKAVNETLSEKLQWAVNDQIKDHVSYPWKIEGRFCSPIGVADLDPCRTFFAPKSI